MNHAYHAPKHTGSLETLAAAQHGLVTRNQLTELSVGRGVIGHRIATGKLQRVRPGVYRIAGAPQTWRQGLLATVLWAGQGAASHRAAAALHELEGFAPGPIEISTTKALRSPEAGVVVHRVKAFGTADVTVVDGIPVTSPARTIVDLAAVVGERPLEGALDDGLRKRLATLTRMDWQLRQSRNKRGVDLLKVMVAQRKRCGVPETELERDFLRLIKAFGFEMPQCQYRIRGVGRVDFAYPDERLAIETDGYGWHSDPTAFQNDRDRDRKLAGLGWRVLRFTNRDLRDRPEEVIKLIGSLKADRRRDE